MSSPHSGPQSEIVMDYALLAGLASYVCALSAVLMTGALFYYSEIKG